MGIVDAIEADWEGFEIRIAKEEDFKILHEHLRHNFFRDEPLCSLAGYSEELVEDFSKLWGPILSQGLCIFAVDKATNKVAGCRITAYKRKGEEQPEPELTSPDCIKVVTILNACEKKANLLESYDADGYANFMMVSVDREFRGRGLALELYLRTIALLKSRNYTLVECIFTHTHSRRNGKKVGFKEIFRMKTLEFLNEKAEPILPNAGPEEFVTVEVLEL